MVSMHLYYCKISTLASRCCAFVTGEKLSAHLQSNAPVPTAPDAEFRKAASCSRSIVTVLFSHRGGRSEAEVTCEASQSWSCD